MRFLSAKAPYTRVTSATDHSDASRASPTWLPYSLRWPSLLLFAVYDIALFLAVALLYWKSDRNFGLIDDDGTSSSVFASRFVPTLLAVVHVLTATIIVDDVKRTEAFAQLASPSGALAGNTLFQKPGQWWTCIWRSFPSRKKERGMRWAMLCSVFLYVLGILVLSPFSASLLIPKEVSIPQDILFNRINLEASRAPLPIEAKQSSYFRTIAHGLQNVSTSAWITDDFFVLPFWPSTIGSPPLGPILSNQVQSWQAQTTVMTSELVCEPLRLEHKAWSVDDSNSFTFVNASMVLSGSKCSYGIFFPYPLDENDDPSYTYSLEDLATNGGSSWSTPSTLALGTGSGYGSASIYNGRLINSTSCSGEIILMSTNPINSDATGSDNTPHHDFDALGYICSHAYYAADVKVTADLSQDNSILSFDKDDFRNKKRNIGTQHLDISKFQDLFLSKNWSYHLTSVVDGHPVVGGPTALLSSFYNFSMSAMMNDPSIVSRAAQMKQRYFGEVVKDAVSSLPVMDTDTRVGTISTIRRRITVVSIAALTLSITLGLQLLLVFGTLLASRLSRRPLGLLEDPASALAAASLFKRDNNAGKSFLRLSHIGEMQMMSLVSRNRYQLQQGSLRTLEDHSTEPHICVSNPNFDEWN